MDDVSAPPDPTGMKAPAVAATTVKAAFGAKNRKALIDSYFDGHSITAEDAWKHVYRLLLWTDATTGLAHCYESDKSQPGKNWYARSLAFHDWLSHEFSVKPALLSREIDWLFIQATEALAKEVLRKAGRTQKAAAMQRAPYAAREFPLPGEDPELIEIVRNVLGTHFAAEPPADLWRTLVERVREYFMLENKRKNLVGEGFEDVIAQVLIRTCRNPALIVHTRRLLQDLPGFGRESKGEKPKKVDIAVETQGMRRLVSAKWSVRADRENQFAAEYTEYVKAESLGQPWEYVFLTNEFDPARLRRACEKLAGHSRMFSQVVHMNTAALRAAYAAPALTKHKTKSDESMSKVLRLIDENRIISLSEWIKMHDT